MEEFGRYVLVERIASGGMAEIFRGASLGPDGFSRPLAIKRILPQSAKDPEFIRMLIDEAKIASTLHHQHLVQVTDLGEINGQYFIAMEYVEGRHLGMVLGACIRQQKQLPRAFAIQVVRDGLLGLAHAHTKTDARGRPLGIVHRDISPQNILVGFDGSVRVADFGIAKAMGRRTVTESGIVKGKFAYMSPEQALGEQVDQRTDLYAMGVVLWESLASARLYPPSTEQRLLLHQVTTAEHRPLLSVVPDVPEALAAVVEKSLHRLASDRYQSAQEFASELSRQLSLLYPGFSSSEISAFMHDVLGAEAEQERQKLAALESMGRRMTADSMPVPKPVSAQAPTSISASLPVPSTPPQGAGPVLPDTGLLHAAPPAAPAVQEAVEGPAPAAPPSSKMGILAGVGMLALGAVALVLVLKGTGETQVNSALPATGQPASTGADVRVLVETEPSGATLLLDGTARGKSPMALMLAQGRRYQLSAEKDGYGSAFMELGPQQDRPSVQLLLPPLPARAGNPARPAKGATSPARPPTNRSPGTVNSAAGLEGMPGTLSIFSEPSAEVIIDGHSTEEHTPVVDMQLPAGTYRVELVDEDKGFKHQVQVEVRAGKSQVISHKFP